MDCDVVVIGAGAAGLAAARDVKLAALNVICVEARDRIGGRICSIHDPLSPMAIEAGAEFVHGRPMEIWEIARENRLALYDCASASLYSENGVLHPDEDDDDEFSRVFEDMCRRAQSGPDETFLDFLNQSGYSEHVKQSATGFVEGFNAARKEIIGIASLAQDARASQEIGGGRSYRFPGGYDAIPIALARGIDVRLNSPVERIEWKAGAVTAYLERGATIGARAAVITLPLGVLQAGTVRLDPEPSETLRAARRLKAGDAVRVVLRFKDRFWDDHPLLTDAGFVFSGDASFPTWWSSLPLRAPLITAWSAGPHADNFAGWTRGQVIDEAVAALERVTGLKPPPPENAYFHDWQQDPFARGAYSYVPAGALPYREKLAEPVENTLFFAGEATEVNGHSATVHGAIASGRAAARKIVQKLPPARRLS